MKLVIVPAALAELQEAAGFYTFSGNEELGLAFLAEFERATKVIQDNPKLGAVFRRRRRFHLRRFPYSVIYQVAATELRVIAVAHQSRRPGYWAGRR